MGSVEKAVRAVEEAATPAPPISQWVRRTRERLQKEWSAKQGAERGNPFTQEAVARRVGVTLKTYNLWENHRVPRPHRLRQIATALWLDAEYFLPTADVATATALLVAEVDRLRTAGDGLEDLLGGLRALVGEGEGGRPRGGHQ